LLVKIGVLNLAAASIAEESKKTRCGFEINTSTKSIILHCKDDSEKQSWLNEIKAVVKELQESRDAQRNIKSDQLQKKKATLHGTSSSASLISLTPYLYAI
jgi:hypothetical protein